MAEKIKKKMGGYRPGAGRKPGSKNKATLEREAIKRAFDQRILHATDVLVNAQLTIARGQTFLYKIGKEKVESASGDVYYKNLRPELVTEQSEIEDYLEELAENNGSLSSNHDPAATYYYLTTKEPNNMAIDSLQNRVHGKPKESLDLSGEVKISLRTLAAARGLIRKNG